MSLQASELILNPDGSIYHLNLRPDDVASKVILVGDPGRVARVTRFFDKVELKKSKREFITHTGWYKGNRISVVSTGIGTDNIDIVLNELDALVNIDLKTRHKRLQPSRLELIRLGTSGAIQPEIPVDAMVLSEVAIGFDGLLHYYRSGHIQMTDLQAAFTEYSRWPAVKATPYAVRCDSTLFNKLRSKDVLVGFTATNPGFYGPQGRSLRLDLEDPEMMDTLAGFSFGNLRITNMEMETAAIYGLAKLMGHAAVSVNCILANRASHAFSRDAKVAVDEMIVYVLEKLVERGP